MSFFITLLVIYAGLFLLGKGMGLQRIMRLEMGNPGLTRLDASAPEDKVEDALFGPAHEWLQANGFHLAARMQMSPVFVSAVSRHHPARYYLSADAATAALLSASTLHDKQPYSLLFISCNAKQERLLTSNRSMEASLPLDATTRWQDDYLADNDAQYLLHQQALNDFGALPCHDIDEIIAAGNRHDAAMLDYWQQSGWITRGPASYRMRLAGAWALLQRNGAHARRLRTAPAPSIETPAAATNATAANTAAAAGAEHFIRIVLAVTQPGNSSGGGWRKALLFAGTLALFLLLGHFQWNFTLLLTLLLVLLLHELGHFLAMLALGYRDLSIFFLPLLGAAASGRHDNAGSGRQLTVFLAGPVPGLLLGLALWFALSSGWQPAMPALQPVLPGFITMLLIINYLNLLPMTPLDGGRVMEVLFFSRFPRANFVFYAVCVAAFALAWHYTQDHVLLVLCLVLAIGLPGQWRLARAASVLRPEFGRHPEKEDAIKALARGFADPGIQSLPNANRSLLVPQLLPRLQQPLTPWRVTLTGSVVYVALLALPLVLLLPALGSYHLPSLGALTAIRAYPDNGYRQALERDVAMARTPLQKMQAHTALVQNLLAHDDEAAFPYASLVYTSITPELDTTPEAADARMVYADTLARRSETEKARTLYAEAYEKLAQAHPEEHERLGQLRQYEGNMLPETAPWEEKARLMTEAYDHFAQSSATVSQLVAGERLALLEHQQGRSAAAEARLREMLTLEPDNPGLHYWQKNIRIALAWLLLDTGRFPESITLLKKALNRDAPYDDTLRALAWAQLQNGQADTARQILHEGAKVWGDAPHPHARMQQALYQLDEVLTYHAPKDNADEQSARQKLGLFIDQHKESASLMSNIVVFNTRDWSHSLAEAEQKMLEAMGYFLPAPNASH